MFQAANIISGTGSRLDSERIQPCWDFHHPRSDIVMQSNGALASLA